VDEQEHTDGAERVQPSADSATAPLPAAGTGERPGRGATARRALTSRAAGWLVAAVLAGVVIGLSVSFARTSPTVVVGPAGAVRQFFIGPAGGPAGPGRQFTISPAGGPAERIWQFVIGPAGGTPPTVVGPFGGAGQPLVIGPAGLPRHIVAGCPPGLPPQAVVIGPGGQPVRAIVIGPPGKGPLQQLLPPGKGPLQKLLPPGVPVRLFLPGAPLKVSWQVGQQIKLPAAATQIPASWAFPQMLPPAALPASAHLHVVAPAWRITLPAGMTTLCQSGPAQP
jgi:hypothetical protein